MSYEGRPRGLCWCGCGERTKSAGKTTSALGNFQGEPQRYLAGHQNVRRLNRYVEEDRGYETSCWIYQGAIQPEGYGWASYRGKANVAHRIYYEAARGSIPAGMELHHRCRQRACVRPDHLEAVTPLENTRHSQPFRTGFWNRTRRRLTDQQVADVRASPLSQKALAVVFGVNPNAIGQIRRRETYKDVE
jgi:hypothetical protein